MSLDTNGPASAATDFSLDSQAVDAKTVINNYLGRFKGGGDLGLAPAIMALALLTLVFGTLRPETFLTKFNFGNYFTQAAPICVLAMGVTFVLLLGEIDLGAGYTAGVSAAVLATGLDGGSPLLLSLAYTLAAAIAMGLFVGWMVARVGVPSFVVTLSTFLSWQGILLLITGDGGTIRIENSVVSAIENRNMPVAYGWVLFAVVVVGYGASVLYKAQARRRRGLTAQPMSIIAAKTTGVAVLWGLLTFWLNSTRGNDITGVPIVIPLVLALVVVLTFILNRTAWGRHLYAVGGNAEAARRAGINVQRIKISAFVMTAVLSAFAGIVLASRLNSVDPTTGGNDTLLIAVGATVIGGTSLFGGRGRIINAVLGGLVFALIQNGLLLLKEVGPFDFSAAGPKFIVNGAVLLLFASIDALSRRRSAAV